MKKTIKTTALISAAAMSFILAGCQTSPQYQQGYPQQGGYAAPNTLEYGYVSKIEPLQNISQGSSGAGIALGAVIGGLLGNQVGGGSGRVAATIAGAVGGGVAGNAIEGRMDNNNSQAQGYRITIQVDNGAQRLYDVNSTGGLRVGERVQVRNGEISRVN